VNYQVATWSRDTVSHYQPTLPLQRNTSMNEYFLSGEDIIREVLEYEIHKYLDPGAACRRAELNVR
jgi:hypothetical protein